MSNDVAVQTMAAALRARARHAAAAAWLLAAALAAAPARAAGPYVVLGAGISDIKADCAGATPCDRSDSGFKLMIGTRGPENVALEGGYWNFGKARVGTAEVSVDGLALTASLHDDFAPEWTAAGRVGFGSFKASGNGADSRKTALIFGFSLGYRVTPQLSVEGFWDSAKPKFEGRSTRLQLMGVQATMSF